MYIKTDFLIRELNRNTDFLNKLKSVETKFVNFYESEEFMNIYDRLIQSKEVTSSELEVFTLSLYHFYKLKDLIFEISTGRLMVSYGDIDIQLNFDDHNFFKPIVKYE
jgi:hypothetical protein